MFRRPHLNSHLLSLLAIVLLHAVPASGTEHRLNVLLLTGKNNHDWQQTTPALQWILEESGRFTVTVLDDPSRCDAELLAPYDAIVSNWTNFPDRDRVWGERSESAIVNFVRSGKGFVLFHAASATFPFWQDYRDMIGAGWGERSGHAPSRAFAVTVVDQDHPITRIVGDFIINDELWHGMDTRPGVHVLCTAYSDTAGGGSGRKEPVAFSLGFGQGRCFNLALGHDVAAMMDPNWRLLVLRGTEWAATGEATIDVPVDLAKVLANASGYDRKDSRERLGGVEHLVQMASRNPVLRRDLARAIAAELTAVRSIEWKRFLCDQLSVIGTSDDVPMLAGLLHDSHLGSHALSALERIPGETSGGAIRHATADAHGSLLVGLFNAIGERRDHAAIPILKEHCRTGSDSAVIAAALQALAKIGGHESADALMSLGSSLPVPLSLLRTDGLLRCAGQFESAGILADALILYDTLDTSDQPPQVKEAAFAGTVRCSGDRGKSSFLNALDGTDEVLQSAAIRFLTTPAGKPFTADAAIRTATLNPRLCSQLMYVLADAGEPAILPALYRGLSSTNAMVRMAAIYGVGRIGDASGLDRLCALVPRAKGAELAEIRKSLVRLRGSDVDERLIVGHSNATVRKEMIRALAARDCRRAVPSLLKFAGRGPDDIRMESLKALGSLADGAIAPDLLLLLRRDPPNGVREAIERTLVSVGGRDRTPDRVRDILLAGLTGCGSREKVSILRVLGEFRGETVLHEIRSSLTDPDPDVRLTAIRVLSHWPESAPLKDLLAIAHGSGPSIPRTLAQRGSIALIENSIDLKNEERVDYIKQELDRAGSDDVRRLLISVLGKQTGEAALHVALSCLEKREVVDEAGAAVADIAGGLSEKYPRASRDALQRALMSVRSPAVVERIRSLLVPLDLRTDAGRITIAVVTGGHPFDSLSFLSLFAHDRELQFTHVPLTDDSEVFEDISAWSYDVIVLYNLTQNIPENRQRNFLQLLDNGVGVLSLHHASGSYQKWDEFRKIIGCRYVLSAHEENGQLHEASTYRHDMVIPIHIVDSTHPITRGLTDLVVQDETYKNCEFESDNRILLSTTEPSSDQPLGWVRTYRQSNVCYLQPGHGPGIFSNEQYRRLVAQAIRWCAEPRRKRTGSMNTQGGREQ
jgi:uncharacterized protein